MMLESGTFLEAEETCTDGTVGVGAADDVAEEGVFVGHERGLEGCLGGGEVRH